MWDVLYAIDASSSMADKRKSRSGLTYSKIESVKQAIVDVVQAGSIPPGCRLGVMAFRAPTKAKGLLLDSSQGKVQQVQSLTPVEDLRGNQAALASRLSWIQVGGATPTTDGLEGAFELLYAAKEDGPKRIKKIVLVTDEKSNVGPKPEVMLDANVVRRAMVDVVAIGRRTHNEAFQALTAKTGGRFTIVDDQSELREALDPRIPPIGEPKPEPILGEAMRILTILELTSQTSASYDGVFEAARAVRERLEKRLKQVSMVEEQTKGEFNIMVSQMGTGDAAFKTSMKSYADRVWPRASEILRLQATEAEIKQVIGHLPPPPR
jgi:von Willebrand factor type A domain